MDFFKKLASNVLDDQENFTDLTQVAVVDADACVTVLSRRFEANAVYTHCGPLLVAVNPYQYIPELYSDEQLEEYAVTPFSPHPRPSWPRCRSGLTRKNLAKNQGMPTMCRKNNCSSSTS